MKEMCPLGDPVARSQARRILRRLDEFREIIFDFRGIDFMGQRLLLYRMDPSAVVDKVKIHGVMSPDRIVGKNGISNLSVGIYGLPAQYVLCEINNRGIEELMMGIRRGTTIFLLLIPMAVWNSISFAV